MQAQVRQPVITAALGNTNLAGLISARVESVNSFSADRFQLRFASSLVQQSLLHVPGEKIEIKIGINGRIENFLTGLVDSVMYNPMVKEVEVEGRDLSALLIETQTNETFSNQTSSDVAVLISLRHGLIPLFDPTSTPVGRYYQSEHDYTSLGQFAKTMTEWDLLASLATREGFDLYVAGQTLRFGLPIITNAQSLAVSDCISLQLAHAVGLARPIDVSVQSWRSKTGDTATAAVLRTGLGPVWRKSITRPNLTNFDAQREAERVADDLKRHEWTASITMPGELSLTARSLIKLRDVPAPWNLTYRVTQIIRSVDAKHGFMQNLRLQGIS